MITRVRWDRDGTVIHHSREPMLDIDIRSIVRTHATDDELDQIAGILLAHIRERVHADRT